LFCQDSNGKKNIGGFTIPFNMAVWKKRLSKVCKSDPKTEAKEDY
jgi:hypothetical protein